MAKDEEKKKKKKKKKFKKPKFDEAQLEQFLAMISGKADMRDVDVVHNLSNRVIKMGLGAMNKAMREYMSHGKWQDALFEIDKDLLSMALRWCQMNKCQAAKREVDDMFGGLTELNQLRSDAERRTKELRKVN